MLASSSVERNDEDCSRNRSSAPRQSPRSTSTLVGSVAASVAKSANGLVADASSTHASAGDNCTIVVVVTVAGLGSDPDGWAGVYILDTAELIEHATNRLTRTFTEPECQQHLRIESCPLPAA